MNIDCAWRSRATTFYQGAEAGAIIARASCERPKIVAASIAAAEYVARPFDFADLQGKPEPSSWGPVYPKTASAPVEKWRMIARGRELSPDEKRAHGAAVGDWIRGLNSVKRPPALVLKYTMPDYAAKCRAEFAATAAADKREWALSKAKSNCVGLLGLTIEQAYAQAMAQKAMRIAGDAVPAPKRLNPANGQAMPIKAARRQRKRVLEAA